MVAGRKFIDFLEEENVPTPYEQLVSRKWSDEVRRLLDTLTPMEARILRWRFGLDDEDELEDSEDLRKIRLEPSRPLSDVLAELKLDGKL